ncbi:ATP-binding cassette domain-containing protein [Mediterraneibacter agrestimuris]|uniref:ATP-binding cassette domain-containing protein n=1 Tax=Mediterraneibacter agrestimuris TaxID=2941333 RepID=UPI00203DB95C|nr:ABC transporter ATP-binding protein [Mediterraneibacter agrestimuris]
MSEKRVNKGNNIILKIENLQISFTQYERGLKQRTFQTVKGMDLEVSSGELTAVIGASGSGKSLLAHAVMGLLPYNASMSGEMYYCGEKLTKMRQEKLRGNEIVLVPQSLAYLDPLMKIGRQIKKNRKDEKINQRLADIFSRYHLKEEVAKQYPFELSGGMNRRILISTAMIENPRLVIADEPTPGLDLKSAKRVMEHFRELADMGAGVLLITHDLRLAIETADRIIVFHDGRTIDEAVPTDFQAENTLKHAYTKALWRAMPKNGFANESKNTDI